MFEGQQEQKERTMKKKKREDEEMLREYDFSGGIRGKHYRKLRNGHTTIIRKSDGSKVKKRTRPIILAPDVETYFPDTESVNKALRGLIALVPQKRS